MGSDRYKRSLGFCGMGVDGLGLIGGGEREGGGAERMCAGILDGWDDGRE